MSDTPRLIVDRPLHLWGESAGPFGHRGWPASARDQAQPQQTRRGDARVRSRHRPRRRSLICQLVAATGGERCARRGRPPLFPDHQQGRTAVSASLTAPISGPSLFTSSSSPLLVRLRSIGPSLLFGLRLWASVSLALYLAFWLQLDAPYWAGASAAIVCQPQLGASLRKGWFRMIGTLIGAAMSVVLVAFSPRTAPYFWQPWPCG
jgi:Fusaric acid resistance protein family